MINNAKGKDGGVKVGKDIWENVSREQLEYEQSGEDKKEIQVIDLMHKSDSRRRVI